MSDFNKELYDEKIGNLEVDTKDLNKRVNALEKIYVTIEKLTSELVELRKDTNEMNERLTIIEKVPGDRYKAIVSYIITAIVGAIVAYVLTKIGIK